ncbi:hypothetical protein CYMTET_9558 [Cymbomonas tetramitiformis]|uniref:Uncharacterized protein n=1 Tax=Cymbomonas tetramitiformis TaxID=36881 RepID=A0AAE0GRF1_9CHLO|nr:hypothetical protein CYMTET_9558 [Cymbomonas tetramitiformis]
MLATGSEDSGCELCGSKSIFRCSICKRARYCGKQHQKEHWREHKLHCVASNREDMLPPIPDVPDAKSRVTGIRRLVEAHRQEEESSFRFSALFQAEASTSEMRPGPSASGSTAESGLSPDRPEVHFDIPSELLRQILSFLRPKELARCSAVCKEWRDMSCEDALWEPLALAKQPVPGSGHLSSSAPTATSVSNLGPQAPHKTSPGVLGSSKMHGLRRIRAPRCGEPETAGLYKAMFAQSMRLENNWRLGRYKTTTFKQHTNAVECLVFQNTRQFGMVLISGAWDGKVQVWRVADGECVRHFSGHPAWVTCVASTANHAASGSTDGSFFIWDMDQPVAMHALDHGPNPTPPVTQARFATASRLATACADSMVRVFDVETGECLWLMAGHEDVVWLLRCIGPTMLLSAARDGTARLWDSGCGECLGALHGHSSAVLAMDVDMPPSAWSAGGAQDGIALQGVQVATGSADHSVKLWDLHSRQCVHTLRGHHDSVLAVTFTHWQEDATQDADCEHAQDGTGILPWLVSGSVDCTVRVWNPRTGACKAIFDSHQAAVTSLVARGPILVSLAPGDGLVMYFCTPSPGQPRPLSASSSRPSSSTGKELTMTRSHDSSVRQRAHGPAGRAREAVAAAKKSREEGFSSVMSMMDGSRQIWAAAVAIDSQRMAVGTKDGTILFLDFSGTGV